MAAGLGPRSSGCERRRLKLESGVGKRKMEVRDVGDSNTGVLYFTLRHMCIQTGDGGAPLFFK